MFTYYALAIKIGLVQPACRRQGGGVYDVEHPTAAKKAKILFLFIPEGHEL
jgi:hypothetical protein